MTAGLVIDDTTYTVAKFIQAIGNIQMETGKLPAHIILSELEAFQLVRNASETLNTYDLQGVSRQPNPQHIDCFIPGYRVVMKLSGVVVLTLER